MLYPYMTLADETEILHTQILYEDDIQKIEIHFERPTENGFNTARCCLPAYNWIIRDGFTDEEIQFFNEFLKYNAHLIYRFAQSGEYVVPSLFKIGGYNVFFWSNKNNEPIIAKT